MLKFLLFSTLISLIFANSMYEEGKNSMYEDMKKDVVEQEVVDEEKLTILSRKPAMRMRVTKKGFNYLNEKATESFNKRMECMKFDEKLVEKDCCSMTMTNTTVATYDPPKFTYSMIPATSTIMWQGLGGQITMEGEWNMKVDNVSLGKIQETGTFKMIMKGFNMNMTMVEGVKDAKPTMHMDTCMFTVDSMQVDFNCTEKIRQFVQDDLINSFWNETMNATVCSVMAKAVENMNVVMQSFKTIMPIGKSGYQVDYSMLGAPKFEKSACESTHMAEITKNNTEVPLLPSPMPSINDMDDKAMVIMQFSDYMMNSFADSIFRTGCMNMTVSNETATPDTLNMLRTTCDDGETCIGSISKDFQKKYPNTTVQLQIHATKPMFIETKPWGMRAYTQSVITVFCNEDASELMRMEVTGRGELKTEIESNNMFMNATLTHMKVTIVKSDMENVDIAKVEKLTEMGLLTDKEFFTQVFERNLVDGIPLPQMDGVTMVEPKLIMADRSMTMMFDISI